MEKDVGAEGVRVRRMIYGDSHGRIDWSGREGVMTVGTKKRMFFGWRRDNLWRKT